MSGKKNVLIIGVFDLFHRGHLEFFKKAKDYGDNLYVVINGDKFTAQYKRLPFFSEEDRKAIISEPKGVKAVDISNTPDAKPFIEKYDIDVVLHGDDWAHESYLKQICCTEEYLAEKGVEIAYTEYYKGVSTSELIKKIASSID